MPRLGSRGRARPPVDSATRASARASLRRPGRQLVRRRPHGAAPGADLDLVFGQPAAAGWSRPHLFVDAGSPLPAACRTLPGTWREGRIGAWSNFYLALAELLHRETNADAYLIVQDDAYFYDAGNLREYLEQALWPGSAPGLVSLYSTEANPAAEPGWHADAQRWRCGALAFVFSPEIAARFITDQRVFQARLHAEPPSHVEIDALLGHWAAAEQVPVGYPVPSLVQHVGNMSTLWAGSANGGPRRARWFAGDLEVAFHTDDSLSSFAESEFPVAAPWREDYSARVQAGRDRMRRQTAVICGLCRDVRHWLPRTAARIEQLGAMFRDYAVVLYENDSRDGTADFLLRWQARNPRVHVLSESLGIAAIRRFATWIAPLDWPTIGTDIVNTFWPNSATATPSSSSTRTCAAAGVTTAWPTPSGIPTGIMSVPLEERVARLERLSTDWWNTHFATRPRPGLRRTVGMFDGDPIFREMLDDVSPA